MFVVSLDSRAHFYDKLSNRRPAATWGIRMKGWKPMGRRLLEALARRNFNIGGGNAFILVVSLMHLLSMALYIQYIHSLLCILASEFCRPLRRPGRA